jgi:ATP-dependent Lon protease
VKQGLDIVPVGTVDEVLAKALTRPLTPVEWTDEDELAENRKTDGGTDLEGVRPH